LALVPSVGLGYLHTFSARPTFQLVESQYQPVRDWGRPQAILGFGLELRGQIAGWLPFVRYQWWGQFPYSPSDFLFPHSILQIGLGYALSPS